MPRRPKLVRVLVVGLCLLLALFLCVEAAHGHIEAAGNSGAHCQLCLLTHAVALPLALATLAVAYRMLALMLTVQPRRGSPARLRLFYIRPPPAIA